MNILVTRNRKSVNLGIRVPVPGNHLFVLDYSFYFYGNICQGLAASAVRSSLYEYSCRNYDSICTKVNLKSGFHITGQLMETYRNNHGASCSSCSSDILSFGRCDKICQIFIGI